MVVYLYVFRNLFRRRLGLLYFTKYLNVKSFTGVQLLNDVHIIYMFMQQIKRKLLIFTHV